MIRRPAVIASATLFALSVAAVGVAAEDGPGRSGEALARAATAAVEGRAAAADLAAAAADGPQGVGSDAFVERHAALAEAHAAHPGNAAAVHEALAAGLSPSSAAPGQQGREDRAAPGRARRVERFALREAAAVLGDDGRPGLGLGRGRAEKGS